MIKIALAGNPNSGKTTLFNALTGSSQYVGNWPGVTVEKKEGTLKGNKQVIIQDLPGIYSLSPYRPEEIAARNYLADEKPDALINIVDASNLERNLYLTSQLLELDISMVIALNMMDVVESRNDKIDSQGLSKRLGCPVIEMSAARGTGIKEVTAAAIKAASHHDQTSPHEFSQPIEKALNSISVLTRPEMDRWFAVKVFENDEKAIERLKPNPAQTEKAAEIRQKTEEEFDDDAESIITDERYQWIAQTLQGVYSKKDVHALTLSDRIDRIVTNRWLAIPIFLIVMAAVYYIALDLVGTPATDWVNDVFIGEWCQGGMDAWLNSIGASEWVISLIVDGIIGGIGAPLGFLPQMAVMFLCLSFLEDCGYMSRIAFIMDRIFRRFGLSGKSFICSQESVKIWDLTQTDRFCFLPRSLQTCREARTFVLTSTRGLSAPGALIPARPAVSSVIPDTCLVLLLFSGFFQVLLFTGSFDLRALPFYRFLIRSDFFETLVFSLFGPNSAFLRLVVPYCL